MPTEVEFFRPENPKHYHYYVILHLISFSCVTIVVQILTLLVTSLRCSRTSFETLRQRNDLIIARVALGTT